MVAGVHVPRFNRYIVECKLVSFVTVFTKLVRFNRYIVECKFTCSIDYYVCTTDLIDT